MRLLPVPPGTVNVQVGGLARTDNAGWGDEFERLTGRLLDGFEAPVAAPSEPVGTGRSLE
jgi:cytochrome c biogenesis protein